MEKLKERYEQIINEYTNKFIKKHFAEYASVYWIGDEIGETLVVNENYYISFSDIVLDINDNIPNDTFMDWYYYCEDLALAGLEDHMPNYKSFIMHAPTLSKENLSEISKYRNEIFVNQCKLDAILQKNHLRQDDDSTEKIC